MTDKQFLHCLHERFQYQHNVNPHTDWMLRLQNIVAATPADQDSSASEGQKKPIVLYGEGKI